MRLTLLIMLLPVMMFFGFLFALKHNALELPGFILWILATLVCVVRGIVIFRQHRRLAWCCFGVALLQVVLVVFPFVGE
jgi:hypothetical protein